MAQSVEAKVRYLSEEWRHREELASIGSRESRHANTRKHDVLIRDARARRDELSLDVNGFVLTDHLSMVTDFGDGDSVKAVYYSEIERLTQKVTGASEVFITDHVLRTEDKSNFNSAYARFVHCDYSLEDPRSTSLKTIKSRHLDPADYEDADFAWYNSWQPFDNEAQSNSLALIDATTIAENDVVDYYYTGNNSLNKSAMPLFNPEHEFWYFDRMRPDEVMFIKQLDTRDDYAQTCPHTSFDNPSAPRDAPPRRSIEVRLLAVFR
ncbi:MAG: CmcJ/NvfI family oxidoreductase [Pseudomonadota bacterium]|nr:CmcJ/NvfI family oxidoreductase [Pseudomonadota bacterium]